MAMTPPPNWVPPPQGYTRELPPNMQMGNRGPQGGMKAPPGYPMTPRGMGDYGYLGGFGGAGGSFLGGGMRDAWNLMDPSSPYFDPKIAAYLNGGKGVSKSGQLNSRWAGAGKGALKGMGIGASTGVGAIPGAVIGGIAGAIWPGHKK